MKAVLKTRVLRIKSSDNIGDVIKQVRQLSGDKGNHIEGIAHTTLYSVEKQKYNLRLGTFLKILKGLGVQKVEITL